MTNNSINTIAAEGFEKAAAVYEQARPSYAGEAISFMQTLCEKPDTIIDLGAGTGKLTRLLGPLGARNVVAMEPVASMRDHLKSIPLITQIVDGSAEHIPFDDHTVDMIICGQSFHWFAHHRALQELHRVLKPNGVLVLLWNDTDTSTKEWAQNITKYVDALKPDNAPRYKTMEWKEAFENQTFFSELHYQRFSHTQRITREMAINRILSTSFVAALSEAEQAKLVDDVKQMLADVDELRNAQEVDVVHQTNVYWCSALPRES